MDLIFEISELKEVIKNFYKFTNFRVTIFNSTSKEIISYPKKNSLFCELIQENDFIFNRYFLDTVSAHNICKKNDTPYIYKSIFGLVNLVTPIIINDIIIGYVSFGQMFDSTTINSNWASIYTLLKNSHCDINLLNSELPKVSAIDEETLSAASQLLEACASYLSTTKKLRPEDSALSYKIDNFIRTNLSEDLTIPFLCSKFNIRKTTFYKISKEYFGMGLSEYIKKVRLKKSEEYLINTNLPISEISSLVGIHDYNYFSKAFKLETRLTPREFRKKYREGI